MMKYSTYKTLHNWFGLVLLVPVSLTALTGILWMHEKSLGLKPEKAKEIKSSAATRLVSSTSPVQLNASNAIETLSQDATRSAISAACEIWGSETVEFDKLEFKKDPNYGLVLKIVAHNAPAATPNEIVWSVAQGEIVERKGGPKLANGQGGTDWAKIVHDLHTGKFFSSGYGFLWSDFGGVAILFLSVTGVILYLMPIFKKRSNQQKRQSAPSKSINRDEKLSSSDPAKLRPPVASEESLLDPSIAVLPKKVMESVS